MKRQTVIISLFLVLAVSMCALAYAGGHYGKGCRSKMGWDDKVMKKITIVLSNREAMNLSEAQYKKLKELKYSLKKDIITKDAEKNIVSLDIKQKLWEDKIDLEGINELIDKKYDVKKAKVKAVTSAYATFKETLTKAQYKEMKELWKSCKI